MNIIHQLKLPTILLIITILIILLPSNSYASENSISYEFITSMMAISESFVLTLFKELAKSFKGLFYVIATFVVVFHAIRLMFNKANIISLIKLLFTIVFVNSLVFKEGLFEEWIYRPLMETVYSLPVFVIKISSGTRFGSSTSATALQDMLATMDGVIQSMREVASMIMEEKSFLSSSWIWFQGLIINLLYLGLYCVFVVMFTIGIVAAHVMLAVAPFAISFIAFEQLRGLSFNVIRAFFSYALIPFFASVAMGMTLSAIKNLNEEAINILAIGNVDLIPDSFFLQALIIGVFSWFFHIKSSEFASQTIGGAISNFGSAFATGMGLAAAGTKLATSTPLRAARRSAGALGEQASKNRHNRWGGDEVLSTKIN